MADAPAHADDTAVLQQVRRQCTRLLADLRRDAADLRRPSRLAAPDALAEGRALYERAAAAAEALLREVEQSLRQP